MRIREVILAHKSDHDWGKWSDGKMPPSAFPLSKRRSRCFRLGSSYRWRVIRFQALSAHFRVLIAYNPAKEQYFAYLACEQDRDLSIIGSLEFHGTHAGWHTLSACGEIESLQAGIMRGPWQKRFPAAHRFHRRTEYGIINDDAALDRASRFFRLHKMEGQML
jgi:hypothetical protein